MKKYGLVAGIGLFVMACCRCAGASELPILSFSADGDLNYNMGQGRYVTTPANTNYPARQSPSFVAGRKAGAVYLPSGAAIELSVTNFNPEEGTISFWFRPDWTTPSGRGSAILLMKPENEPNWQRLFHKGTWANPESCAGRRGTTDCGAYNLFTAGVWRHYALRWSRSRNTQDIVVDGEPVFDSVRAFKTDSRGLIRTAIRLGDLVDDPYQGGADGALDELKMFDRYLKLNELIKEAGVTKVAYCLHDQVPPGGCTAPVSSGALTYVDPTTGQQVTRAAAAQGTEDRILNPDQMKNIPPTTNTQWARPLVGGPVKALIIIPNAGELYNNHSALRECIELWQRLDVDCDICAQPSAKTLARDYDVIVVGAREKNKKSEISTWVDLDDDMRRGILERVRQGRSGLVIVTLPLTEPERSEIFNGCQRLPTAEILRGFPTAIMPKPGYYGYDSFYEVREDFLADAKMLADENVQVFGNKKVRAVWLNYKTAACGSSKSGLTPDTTYIGLATDVHYDYWQALLARAMLFAARRTSAATIVAADWKSGQWEIEIAGLNQKARLWYRSRDMWGREYGEGEITVTAAGRTRIQVSPLFPRSVTDFILKDRKGRVLDWYSAVVPPAKEICLENLTLDKPSYFAGDVVKGKALVRSGKPGEYQFEINLADHAERRVARQTGKLTVPDKGTVACSFELTIPASSESLFMRVEFLLSRDGAPVDWRSTDCSVPKRSFDGFYAMACTFGNNFVERQLLRMFRDRFSMNGVLIWTGTPYGMAAKYNLFHFLQVSDLGRPDNDNDFDITAPDKLENYYPKNLRCDPVKAAAFRPLFFALGQEHYVVRTKLQDSPSCITRFQEYIKQKYQTLDKVNALWRTDYTSWEQVGSPISSNNFAKIPRFDVRRFYENMFADRHAYLAAWLRKAVPDVEMGIHTGWELCMLRGYDYWRLSKGMESMISYAGVQNLYIRSFFKNYYGMWWHYNVGDQADVRWHPWFAVASGARGFAWYTPASEYWGGTAADLNLSSDWVAAAPEFMAAARAGDLLSRMEYQQDQVGIHYSQDSVHAYAEGLPYYYHGGILTWIHTSFMNLLFDAGIPFRFVAYEQVADGELLRRKYPLFILPHSYSLSAAEAKGIRDYVAAGGVLWADIMPGIYDDFGQSPPKPMLADLFTGMDEVSLPGGKTIKLKKTGAGTVILGDMGNYTFARNVGKQLPAREMLERIIQTAKVERVAEVHNHKDGQWANGIWTAGYRQGDQRYVVVAKDYQLADRGASKVDIRFPRKGHVYEMRSGDYYGDTDEVTTELESASGKVFAILPYKVRKLTVTTSDNPQRGKDLVLHVALVTKGEISADARHVIRVNVTDSDGREVTALRRLVVLKGGAGEIALPIAYNDQPGSWTVQLRDSATGVERHIHFELDK